MRRGFSLIFGIAAISMLASPTTAAEVRGRVTMPSACSPEVSPAVVTLRPKTGSATTRAEKGSAEVALVHQRGLQFTPRVQAIRLGTTIRFTNQDSEMHNVHVQSTRETFNQSMAPGLTRDFTPERAGVVVLGCDVHAHMRGYVVVSATPWFAVCSRTGAFRVDNVPAGEYEVEVWHEMGRPYHGVAKVETKDVDLGVIELQGEVPLGRAAVLARANDRTWGEVIDRVGMLLSASLKTARRPNGLRAARRLAEDAYFVEFEGSDFEVAVRNHLDVARAAEVEAMFRKAASDARGVSDGSVTPDEAERRVGVLLARLVDLSKQLDRKGITSRSALDRGGPREVAGASGGLEGFDRAARLAALSVAFVEVRAIADRGDRDDAASALATVYFEQFEPIERAIMIARPGDVVPLETTFNAIRGGLREGLRGETLANRLDGLRADVEASLDRCAARPAGTFGAAFASSLITIVREGMEVILLLTMLAALGSKAGRPGAVRALAWGVAAAVAASGLTAWGLNSLVNATQGRTREVIEGLVLLAASGVLFYVSYWLISQTESKRWIDFIKRRAGRESATGGFAALGLTAFLAVYREGAETALLYQAMIAGQGGARAGLLGLAAGLGVGAAVLGVIAVVIRVTSVRLPMRTFFQFTGLFLFAMSVVFAGNGVFELQSSGVMKITPLAWLGGGLPILGLHPTLQAIAVQALFVAGAGLALALYLFERGARRPVAKEKAVGAGV